MEKFRASRKGYGPAVAFALLLLLTGDAFAGERARGDGKSTSAGALPQPEGASRGFPAMFDLSGKRIADGDFTQWLEGERLHVKISYELGGGHRIEEKDVFRQQPAVVQEQWSWQEFSNNKPVRRYLVNFESGQATAEKEQKDGLKRWTGNIKVQPGRTFTGFGFTPAIKALRARLVRGEKMELQAVGFTPKPRVVTVEVSYGGLDKMEMGQRKIVGERYVIHPKVPFIAKAFVNVHDTKIWLTPPPSEFLRWEGRSWNRASRLCAWISFRVSTALRPSHRVLEHSDLRYLTRSNFFGRTSFIVRTTARIALEFNSRWRLNGVTGRVLNYW